ncbi:MAG TPA: hypothetical protein VHY34_03065, partial [Caulobacteraceae bacterium]|nr:hypothetical protein [Caulobacteraceae bacterium]
MVLLWGGPRARAFAQAAEAPPTTVAPTAGPSVDTLPADPPSGEASSATAAPAPAPDAPAIGTDGDETPIETAGAGEPSAIPQSSEAPPIGAKPPIGASAVETPVETEPGAGELSPIPQSSEAPPIGAKPPIGESAVETPKEPGADASQADAPPVEPFGTAAQLALWVAATDDNGDRPFVIVDKLAADVFVYSPNGRLEGAAPVLLGEMPGDDSAPGVGDRDLSAIAPDERTTPAGRFVARFGPASGHRTVLWVDYVDAISLHPVITTNRREHRLERLRSPLAQVRRITYGCINVPTDFYRDVVLNAFADGGGVVYILPETKPLAEVLPAFAVAIGANAPTGAAVDAGAQQVAGSQQVPG